ncbi:acetylxylan esterase [Virgibacillus oceani]|uniref:Cephalosporin-C deacetylase n=1 Tax=Virgibacillus oceani TaxID=1479511 RepID=A0A917M2K1_9BACI|nr:alpha/beta fold hydrolase [Virgibacillus oceani]GGG72844.1 cephalosporin-C deacetylase [Virgibacillus oceani]
MKHIKETIKQLESYIPESTKRPDHHSFWKRTLQEARKNSLDEKLVEIDYPIKQVRVYDLSYNGFDDTPIKGFYMLPREHQQKLPCLIIFHGYMGNKGSVSQYMKWLIQGYAVIAVDVRGQGRSGDYSSYASDGMGSWVVKGILDKEDYYYRKVYTDGVRAVDFACSRPEIDAERIGIMGASMGGGITLAAAALDDRPKLAIADMPNMCDIPLMMEQKLEGSLTIVENLLHRYPEQIELVYDNLTYFDNLNLSASITCKTRFSVGLKDLICPPQPIFGVYNQLQAPKSMEIYPFAGHDMNIIEHIDKTIAFINENL